MEQLLAGGFPLPGGAVPLARLPSGAFFVPLARTHSTRSGDIPTDTSSATYEEADEEMQDNPRRISMAKQVLEEATMNFARAPVATPTLKSSACRNSGALLPLLNMLAACSEPSRAIRTLSTLSFLMLDKANRRVCHELRALDVLLDMLRRASDQQVLIGALEALCGLCRHDAKDKMALWQHPNKGALLSMLSNRHSSVLVIETLRTCRALCFAAGPPAPAGASGLGAPAQACGSCLDACCGSGSGRSGALQDGRDAHRHGHHVHHHGAPQLLEPALLTVVSELLHPATDTQVLMKALKLLNASSSVNSCATQSPGCWHNAVFRIVPLLTHCADVEVVESALSVLVNLSEHTTSFSNMFFASGSIPPLLHLLNHKRCPISQSASCVLSALAEGGLSRDKLCQDTALLAMLRVLQTNHCVVVTLGVLYMLGRLASYRAQVVRSLKGWGAIQLLMRLLATTRDKDAADGCKHLLQLLGVTPPAVSIAVAAPAAIAAPVGTSIDALQMPTACSIPTLSSGSDAVTGILAAAGPMAGVVGGGGLLRTISAAAAVAAAVASEIEVVDLAATRSGAPVATAPAAAVYAAVERARRRPSPNYHSSFRFPGGVACGMAGPIAAAVPPAAAY